MQYRPLGTTDLEVSVACLGTMTWGEQNSEREAHEQLDYAVAQGINFVDTAELYAFPPRPGTQGSTEAFIGSWLRQRGGRERLVLATKIAGPGRDHIRNGRSTFTAANLREAVEGSLRRMATDYIDLYQLHWPMRRTNVFGRRGYQHAAGEEDDALAAIGEALEALGELVQSGKVRHIGVSNETPWGTMKFLQLAEERGLPRIQAIQNPYNLLNRSYDVGMAEISHRESCGLLAYSPLAFGTLTGKYLGGRWPEGARLTLFPEFKRYLKPAGQEATARYVELARNHGLDPATMALAFVHSRSFVTSTIIGATSLDQLRSNVASVDDRIPEEVAEGIEAIRESLPDPCP